MDIDRWVSGESGLFSKSVSDGVLYHFRLSSFSEMNRLLGSPFQLFQLGQRDDCPLRVSSQDPTVQALSLFLSLYQ